MIDDKSMEILKIIQEKARIPNVEVARQVGMTPSAVLERIRKLERQGVINGYEVRLNPKRFGRNLVAFIMVEAVSGQAAETGERLTELSCVQEIHFISGEDGFLVKLRVQDAAELGRIIREEIAAISGVRHTRTWVALDTLKETSRFPIRQNGD